MSPNQQTAAHSTKTSAADNTPPNGIVWLASFPKSGNTWCRNFLHNLIRVMQGEENPETDINEMGEFSVWDISSKRYEKILGYKPTSDDYAIVAKTRPQVQHDIAYETDGVSFVKTHNALVLDQGVPTINFAVTSGAIYIVRNPLDVAISYAHHINDTIDVAIEWMERPGLVTDISNDVVHEVYTSWSQNVESWTRKPQRTIYIMRYEEMQSRPEITFGNLARHLLMQPTKEQLVKAIELSSFKRLQKQEEKDGFKEKPKNATKFFRSGKVGEWREVLSDAQIKRIIKVHKKQMKRFGYYPLKKY